MTDKEKKQGVFDPISQKWHFEAHGDRWASLADNKTNAMAEVISTINNKKDQLVFSTPIEHYSMMFSDDACGPASILAPENGSIMLKSFFPLMDGLPNSLTLRYIHKWEEVAELEGDIFAWHEGQEFGLSFFDPFFSFDVPRLEENQEYTFYLAAWAYSAHKSDIKDRPLKDDSGYLDTLRKMNATISEANNSWSLRGARAVMPMEYAAEYAYNVPVEEVKEVSFCGFPMLRITTTFYGVEDPIRGYLFIPKHSLGDYEPQIGDDIGGTMWLTGYLAQDDKTLMVHEKDDNPPYAQLTFKTDEERHSFERWLIDRSPFGVQDIEYLCPSEGIDWQKVYELWLSEVERQKEGWYCSFDDIYGELFREFRGETPLEKGSHDEQYAKAKELMSNDTKRGISKIMQLAHKGHIPAMIDAGDLFLYGYYLPQNLEKAFEYFSKVHEAGETGCTSLLASCYMFEKGTDEDIDKAMQLLQRADTNNDPKEYLGIGICLTGMAETPEQYENAANYYRAAIVSGYYEACFYLDDLFKKGLVRPKPEEINPLVRGANDGHDACLYCIGISHLHHAMDKNEWSFCEELPTPLDSFRYGLRLVSRAAEHGFRDAVALMDSTETFTLADGTEITINQLLNESQ